MNSAWILAVMLYVLIEKMLPFGVRLAKTTGGVMFALGFGCSFDATPNTPKTIA